MVNAFNYSNTAAQTTLSGNISAGATSFTVAATTGFPAVPYVLALDFGAATEELVKVTSAAGTTLTVERGFSGTSAQSHSTGAVVRHTYNAQDATDFRTHEASTGAVHGLTGSIVGTSDTQTLSNKTLTSPTINAGALSGTFTGTPTFSGAATFTGGPSFTTNSVLFQRAAASSVAMRASVTGDAADRHQVLADGTILWGPGNTTPDVSLYREGVDILATNDIFRVIRGSASNNAFSARVSGDTSSRYFQNADGEMNWGSGSASTDTNLYRSAANELKTDDSFVVGGNLTATGVGAVLFARKTADTIRSTATLSDDPHLTFSVAGSATYEVTGLFIVDTSDATNADFNLDWTVPAGATGKWQGLGQGTSDLGGVTTPNANAGLMRTVTSDIDAARSYGAIVDSSNQLGITVNALLITSSAGTYAASWARTGGSGALTLVANSYLILRRVA